MAQKVQIVLVDDLDGGPAEETVRFGLDGVGYEIDLSAENAAVLRDVMAAYVGHARRVGAAPRSKSPRSRRSGATDVNGPGAIRAWAKSQGIEIGERGRIPVELRARYDESHH
jgi:hypothetical protein